MKPDTSCILSTALKMVQTSPHSTFEVVPHLLHGYALSENYPPPSLLEESTAAVTPCGAWAQMFAAGAPKVYLLTGVALMAGT